MSDEPKRCNVIWVFGDQHRGQALSMMGDPNVSTPHVDRLAAEGRTFTAAFAGFPLCCPFRGSLVTSRYPHECVPGHEYRMPPELPTIAHAFKEQGYHTAYFGKWHLDGWKESEGRAAMHIVPPERRGGFDEWVGYDNNNAQWDSWVHGGEGDEAFHYRLPGYETDCLTDLLIDYLERQAEAREATAATASGPEQRGRGNFFAVLSVQPPHGPYVAPAEFMAVHNPAAIELRPNVPAVPHVVEQARRDLAGYYAQIEDLDWNLGRVREALAVTGLADETYVVFFSDHGDLHGSHGQFKKTSPYQESISIPFVVAGGPSPYENRRGRTDVPLNHVDIAPTTLGLAGLEAPDWMRGADLSGHVRPDRETREGPDSAFLQAVIPTMHGNSIDRPWRGVVRRDGWKYVCLEGQPWLMFNLAEDPYEQVNLAHNTRFRAERARLHERLTRWVAETGDEFALPDL